MIVGTRTRDNTPVELEEAKVATSGTAILAMRGAGKSWLNAVLAENLLKSGFPVVIVDPEGEYWTLKVAFENITVAGGEHAELPLSPELGRELANVVIDERMSLILDMSDMRRLQQFPFLSAFLEELFFLETDARVPLWVSFEEADLWVPQKSENPCKNNVLDICQRGRKRGLGFSLVSQRPATLDKTALSQAEYRFFKRFQQPHDLNAISEYLGPYAKLASRLPELRSLDALIYAPTEFEMPEEVTVATRISPHGGATPEQMARVKSSAAISSIRARLEALILKDKEEKSVFKSLQTRVETLERQLDARGKELERAKAALDVATALKFAPMRDGRVLEVEKNDIEFRIDSVDPRTGKVLGNRIAHLLFNEFEPEERAVYLTLLKLQRPLNAKDFSTQIDYGRSTLSAVLRRLEKKNLIRRVKSPRRGKYYVANKS